VTETVWAFARRLRRCSTIANLVRPDLLTDLEWQTIQDGMEGEK